MICDARACQRKERGVVLDRSQHRLRSRNTPGCSTGNVLFRAVGFVPCTRPGGHRDSNTRIAGHHHGPAPLDAFTAASICPHGSRTRSQLAASDREYTPARSADSHRPEAHWRRASILLPVGARHGHDQTPATVVRSLLAGERSCYVTGCWASPRQPRVGL